MTATSRLRGNKDAYLALAAVCLFWGTTYLGIRIALEAFQPLYLIAIRYTISGALMVMGAKLFGAPLPRGRELWLTALYGSITIGIGNGCLALAEVWVPSGLAALFITTSPFWMVGFDALLPGGKKPLAATMWGLAAGLAGVAFLVLPAAMREGVSGGTLSGFLLLQFGAAGWVFGSLLQKRVVAQAHPFVNGGVQQLATGLVMFVPATIFEKPPTSIPLRPGLAVVYLVCFGSIIGYSSFIYSITRLPVAVVSIYTYINPIVAVFLGWLFFREAFGLREMAAMLIIFLGIGIVKWSESSKRVRPGGALAAVVSGEPAATGE